MTVNILKTLSCVLNKKLRLDKPHVPILFDDKPIEECEEYDYFGILFRHG